MNSCSELLSRNRLSALKDFNFISLILDFSIQNMLGRCYVFYTDGVVDENCWIGEWMK